MYYMINTVSITDLKQNTAQILKGVKTSGKPTLVLQRSQIAAVLVDSEYFNLLEKALEDIADIQAIEERKNEPLIPFEKVAKKMQLQ